jgi:hypothetical protein
MLFYLVTIKLPRNPAHNPRDKQIGTCPVRHGAEPGDGGALCSDVTGEHHTYLYAASSPSAAITHGQLLYGHVTRVEEADIRGMSAALVTELREAYAALPDDVSGDAAPADALLADRINALAAKRDELRATRKHCHERHLLVEAAARALLDAVEDHDPAVPAEVSHHINALGEILAQGHRAVTTKD